MESAVQTEAQNLEKREVVRIVEEKVVTHGEPQEDLLDKAERLFTSRWGYAPSPNRNEIKSGKSSRNVSSKKKQKKIGKDVGTVEQEVKIKPYDDNAEVIGCNFESKRSSSVKKRTKIVKKISKSPKKNSAEKLRVGHFDIPVTNHIKEIKESKLSSSRGVSPRYMTKQESPVKIYKRLDPDKIASSTKCSPSNKSKLSTPKKDAQSKSPRHKDNTRRMYIDNQHDGIINALAKYYLV